MCDIKINMIEGCRHFLFLPGADTLARDKIIFDLELHSNALKAYLFKWMNMRGGERVRGREGKECYVKMF